MGDISQSSEIMEMRLMELKLFIIEFNKASQLDRSFMRSLLPETKVQFRTKLIDTCIELMGMIDKNTFTNEILRKKIDEIMKVDENISIGQAQKVVNVVMKQYCFILNKENLYKELDCPLDRTTMRHKNTMKTLSKNEYLKYQADFKDRHGLRILADYVYDIQRLNNFLGADAAN